MKFSINLNISYWPSQSFLITKTHRANTKKAEHNCTSKQPQQIKLLPSRGKALQDSYIGERLNFGDIRHFVLKLLGKSKTRFLRAIQSINWNTICQGEWMHKKDGFHHLIHNKPREKQFCLLKLPNSESFWFFRLILSSIFIR